MSRRLLFLPLCAALPALLYAQEPKLINCRTLESAGNFVGPDEVIVNDMVCQKAKPGANTSAPPAEPKAVPGVVISDPDGASVVDAAKAASRRVAAAKDAIKEKQNSEQVNPAPPSESPAVPAPTPRETPAEPLPDAEPAKAPETTSAAKQPMSLPAKPPRPEVAGSAPQPAPTPGAEPFSASTSATLPVAAAEPAPPSVPAGSAAASTQPRAATPEPAQIAPLPEPATAPAESAVAGSAAPAQPTAVPASETPATSAPESVLKSPTPAPEPTAAQPAVPAENNPPAPAVAETPKSAAPAPAVEPPRATDVPAGGTGFYDANAGTNVVTNPRPDDAAATKVPAEPRKPTEAEVAAKAAAEEAEASLRAPDPNLPRERVVETGAFVEPKEVGPDPATLARQTNFQPGDNEGFEEGHRADCTKNVTIGGLKGEKLVLGTPDWAARWIEKNQKRMLRICFSDTPMATAKNYLIVFYTAPTPANGAALADLSATPQGTPAGGVGAFTLGYGSTWHYAQERNVGVTVLTRDVADEPQAEMAKVWYATAYTEEGVPVSEHWPDKTNKPIQLDQKDTKSKKAKEARAEIERITDELLDQMVGDIAKL